MTDTFVRLRPFGDGYTLVSTGRNDAPMFHVRFLVAATATSPHDTEVLTSDYLAAIAGFNFDGAADEVTSLYMDPDTGSGHWFLYWDTNATFGTDAFIDVLFISKGFGTTILDTTDETP